MASLALAALTCASCGGRSDGEAPAASGDRARLSLTETLSGPDTAGFLRALGPVELDFPRDHGPHPDFRTEWWYVTGNVRARSSGRRFGFQWTVFRSALAAPEAEEGETAPGAGSAWRTRQAYLGHFAVTDPAAERFHAAERFARGAAGLAGARPSPFRVWVGDWELASRQPGALFPMGLRAADRDVAVDLTLERRKPLVLQGEGGWSPKGPEPGNASHYYSFTRLAVTGRVIERGDTLEVEGTAWLDREWSTSALSEGVVGWDWVALQLDDGWDLTIYRLRSADGSATPFSDGVLVDPDGRPVELVWGEDVLLEAMGAWASPIDGTVYPSVWSIRLPRRGWDLEVEPVLAAQELDLSFRYWEGAVEVRGTGEGGRAVEGWGYVELTGYAADPGR